MAECRFCHKSIPQGVARCPHCKATLQPTPRSSREGVSPFEARLKPAGGEKKSGPQPGRTGRLPASRLALLGCLGLVVLLLIALLLTVLLAPDTVRTLVRGKPTPLPPTPRPTPTATPIPTPTPEWTSYTGSWRDYEISLPPYWVAIDFTKASWERAVRLETMRYSWMAAQIDAEQAQQAADEDATWGFDPRHSGQLSLRAQVRPDLTGKSAAEIRDSERQALLEIPATLGGRATGGMRSDLVEVGGEPAAYFELLVQPLEDSKLAGPTVLRFYGLANRQQGYWIQVVCPQAELEASEAELQAILDSFRMTPSGAIRHD